MRYAPARSNDCNECGAIVVLMSLEDRVRRSSLKTAAPRFRNALCNAHFSVTSHSATKHKPHLHSAPVKACEAWY
jgi:hypothetical protein